VTFHQTLLSIFLVAAQKVANMLGKSVTAGMLKINETKHK